MRRLVVLLCGVLLTACSGGGNCVDGQGSSCPVAECIADDGGALDCSEMCRNYCSKLSTCNVMATDTCQDDCVTVSEAGSSTTSKTCVIQKTCEEISTCGI